MEKIDKKVMLIAIGADQFSLHIDNMKCVDVIRKKENFIIRSDNEVLDIEKVRKAIESFHHMRTVEYPKYEKEYPPVLGKPLKIHSICSKTSDVCDVVLMDENKKIFNIKINFRHTELVPGEFVTTLQLETDRETRARTVSQDLTKATLSFREMYLEIRKIYFENDT